MLCGWGWTWESPVASLAWPLQVASVQPAQAWFSSRHFLSAWCVHSAGLSTAAPAGSPSWVPRTKILLFRGRFVQFLTPQISPPALERRGWMTKPCSQGSIQHIISCCFPPQGQSTKAPLLGIQPLHREPKTRQAPFHCFTYYLFTSDDGSFSLSLTKQTFKHDFFLHCTLTCYVTFSVCISTVYYLQNGNMRW